MTSVQKVIKYGALALALFIIVSIIVGIGQGLGFISNVFDDKEIITGEGKTATYQNITNIDMEISHAQVFIKEDKEFRTETNVEGITINENDHTLVIKEEDEGWFSDNDGGYVIVCIPEGLVLDNATIETGAGTLEIEELNTNYLDLELGAGELIINNINVYKNTDIEGGAGKIDIQSGELTDVSMSIGAGKADVIAKISGENKFEVGVGALNLTIEGKAEDYTFDVSKGLGDVTIDGTKAEDGSKVGNGFNEIQLDDGIGSITVNFK